MKEIKSQPQGSKFKFNVVLIAVGNRKIEVIKEVLAITGLGLKGSKDIVDAAPSSIKQGVNKDEATKIKARLEAVGATVEIKEN